MKIKSNKKATKQNVKQKKTLYYILPHAIFDCDVLLKKKQKYETKSKTQHESFDYLINLNKTKTLRKTIGEEYEMELLSYGLFQICS